MGIIGVLFVFWLSKYIPALVGAVIGAIVLGITIISFVERVKKRQELKIFYTIGTLVVCAFFIWWMLR